MAAASSSAPAAACILVDSTTYVDTIPNGNETTAAAFTSKGNPIQVSLWPARPPIPSRLSVRCRPSHPDEVFFQEPSVIRSTSAAESSSFFFLLRIAFGRRPAIFPQQIINQKMRDYFVYHLPAAASAGRPSLRLLKNPHPYFFADNEVALLPRGHGDHGGEHFTVAALCQPSYYNFMLHVFKSEDWDWSSKTVLVDPPQIHYPMPIVDCRHFDHGTNSAITLEGGTVGWVDLWRGILFYDVFLDTDKVRFLPLPPRLGMGSQEKEIDCCPVPYRSIAVIGDCLKLIELTVSGDRLPGKDPETRGPKLRIDDWALTTYTYDITAAGDGWKTHRTVKASDLRIDRAMHSVLRRRGMLRMDENNEAAEQKLQNLWTCQPVLSLDEEGGIVYLIARVKFQHPKAWLLAVDMRRKQVQAVAKIETDRSTALSLAYFPCRISGYLNDTMQVTGCLRD